jgi:two-component system LytT family response regulator
MDTQPPAPEAVNRQRFLFIKIDGEYLKVCYPDIIYVEAVNKYVRIVTRSKLYLVSSTMHDIENILPHDIFCRIHRSYIISLEHTEKFDHDILYIDKKQLPIGKQYKNSLCSKVTTLYSDAHKQNKRDAEASVDQLLKKINP